MIIYPTDFESAAAFAGNRRVTAGAAAALDWKASVMRGLRSVGPYEILAPLGSGGMGEIYRARDTRLGRLVAIKVLNGQLGNHPVLRDRFEREAKALAGLNHPHICALYDVGRESALDYLVMEYLEGKTLEQKLEEGMLPVDEAILWAMQIAEALDQMHRRGILHRDIKPGNIMLTASGAKLMDFGLAKATSRPIFAQGTLAVDPALTMEGAPVGTLPYMAPEQLVGSEVDARTDIFSLGCVLYQMIAGRRPFQADSQAGLIAAILSSEPERPSSVRGQPGAVSPLLNHAVEQCLAKDPDERWQTARDLMLQLEWIGEGGVPDEVPRLPRWEKTSLAWLISAVLGIIIIIVAAISLPGRMPSAQLSVLPPEGTLLRNSSISPDGRYLAFTAVSGKVPKLWIRALDSVQAEDLPGTEQAAYPFWSPDSKWVGFFSVGRLKKIQISGGPAQTICDTQAAFGGSWGSRHLILFAQRPAGTISYVSADGGIPKPATVLDMAGGDLAHVFPYFLPDGRHFLYSVVSRGPGDAALRVGFLESSNFKFLLNADLGAAYAPPHAGRPGTLLFAYHGGLMSQEFDAEDLTLIGTASRIARRVRHVAGRADISTSRDGIWAYQGSSEEDRQLTWFDRNGRALRTAGGPNNYRSVSLSPDEKRLAIEASDSAGGRSEIWILDLRRGSLYGIGPQTTEGFSPVWSPEGKEVVFSSVTPSGMSLLRQALDQTRASPLLELEGVKVATDWSGDGKYSAYTSPWPDLKKLSIWAVPTRGSEKNRGHSYASGGYNECCAVFSPGRLGQGPRWMAYSSDETGQEEIYVKTFPSGDRKWQVSSAGGWQPHWRQDGRELFYLAPDSKLMAVDIAAGPRFVSGAPHALFETTIVRFNYPELPVNSYSVSGNGQRFLVNAAIRRPQPESITVVLPSH